ncbi:TPA: N-6 DNA methylase [Yersinia enterocolitica]|uniref:N-6 DNA methylase n=1 Tax=Yersinia enterocolitica TaxID=630 RepID=UPI0029BF3C3A|nr:N-6 DNA methylase [Yersinia enterocolitica]HEN3266314.1 N-6 DNA methylase [Yersinia enterocolitica]HEN3472149.1 N-6 DNA methylase [Yersinia enterocolitica]
MSVIEQDTRFIIDSNLTNKGWILDISNPGKNVFFESDILRIIDNPLLKKTKKRPDYVLIDSISRSPIAVIEAKSGGQNLDKALDQAMDYAEILQAPLVFAMNNSYCETRHLYTNKPLYIDEQEVNELIRQKDALEFINQKTNEIYITPKEVLVSRHELINIFKNLNNTLRGEGLRAGIERLSEFANILFLKLYTENKDQGIWSSIKNTHNDLLISSVNEILKRIESKYGASVFSNLQIKKPETLKDIINRLDKLKLSTIDSDIKGDAFEYFLQQATATSNDLGEYFTPRHITKTIVNLVNPKFKEKVYDPFCGTGGFLTESFNHIKNNTIIETDIDKKRLKQDTVFGREITSNARLAKMNMILHGDGHSGVEKMDSLASPVNNEFDIVITNMPFSQKTIFSHLYENKLAKNSGDGVCVLHCFKAVKKGGRMALIVPEGFLFRENLKAVRKYLFQNSTLKSVISLPKEVFLPYAKVKTAILYFVDCHNKPKPNSNTYYFNVENDGFSLDNHRRKIQENDLKNVDYIDFNKKNIEDIIADLGFSAVSENSIINNDYIFNYSHYADSGVISNYPTLKLKQLIEASGKTKVGSELPPIMSITMENGLVNQSDKFKKRIASQDISSYKKVFLNELVVGFPIDEGVLGFQKIHPVAAVSPAYKIWKIKSGIEINIDYIDFILRSDSMRKIYKSKMQGSVERRRVIPDEMFLNIDIPMPPINVQNEIVEKFKLAKELEQEFKSATVQAKNKVESLWS